MEKTYHQPSNGRLDLPQVLHLFNNQLFRIYLHTEALSRQLKERDQMDDNTSELLKKIQASIMQASKSAQNVNDFDSQETTG